MRVETKSSDDVFLLIVVSIQYQYDPENTYNAFYKLSNLREQLSAYVFDVVRATVPKIPLNEVFTMKARKQKRVFFILARRHLSLKKQKKLLKKNSPLTQDQIAGAVKEELTKSMTVRFFTFFLRRKERKGQEEREREAPKQEEREERLPNSSPCLKQN